MGNQQPRPEKGKVQRVDGDYPISGKGVLQLYMKIYRIGIYTHRMGQGDEYHS